MLLAKLGPFPALSTVARFIGVGDLVQSSKRPIKVIRNTTRCQTQHASLTRQYSVTLTSVKPNKSARFSWRSPATAGNSGSFGPMNFTENYPGYAKSLLPGEI